MSHTETEKKILRVLVLKGPSWHYHLWQKMKVAKSNKAVLENLHSLLEKRLIREIGGLGGRSKIVYAVTIPGLFEGIDILSAKEFDEKIDRIARKHADKLPFIFGKWPHFKKHGFRKQAIFNLRTMRMVYKLQDYYEPLERLVTYAFLFSDFRIMHFYDTPVPEFFAVEQAKFHVKELNRMTEWIQMLMLDQDLREYVRKEFNWLISDVSQYLKTLKKIRSLAIKD